MDFPIVDGRVKTRSLEVHIVDHCNLHCWGCCSLSPILPLRTALPSDLADDLHIARRALSPTWFKLVGGEPLLHPQIVDCLRFARESQIAEIVSVTTNGWLLPRMPEEFWRQTDAITISLYPQPPLPAGTIEYTKQMAARFQVRLNWKSQPQFVDMTRDFPETDAAVNEEVWRTCWLRRSCHILANHRFYACPRPSHFQTFFAGREDFSGDGVPLHTGPGLAAEIRDYLLREQPLMACVRCRGGNAELQPHRQLSRLEVQTAAQMLQ